MWRGLSPPPAKPSEGKLWSSSFAGYPHVYQPGWIVHSYFQVIPCTEVGCPIDCRWQAWSQWTECSPVRRRGKRRRRREEQHESRLSVLIQEIPVVDSRQGETTVSECSQGRTRARHREAENGGSDCQGEEVEERYCWSQICQGKPEFDDDRHLFMDRQSRL